MVEEKNLIVGNTKMDETIDSAKKQKKDRKKKKEKKRKRNDEEIDVNDADPAPAKEEKELKKESKGRNSMENGDKEARRRARKEERQAKKKEKESLKDKIPKVDEDGIAYTKLQIKRMLKRVKQGLPPVPTEEEERERQRNEAQLLREEQAELAGMVFRREDDEVDTDGDKNDENEDEDEAEEDDGGESDQEGGEPDDRQSSNEVSGQDQQPPKKKPKRSKPVPPDYVCQACKNLHKPAHWIYDCPDKKTMKGINNKKKKERGINQPDDRKLFVSGLPFDIKPSDVEHLFQGVGEMTSCKLVKFKDTGRCNGQAYVTFGSDEAASKALKLSGTMIDANANDDKKKKKTKNPAPDSKRGQLKLKISRVLNRRLTKTKTK